MSLVPFVWWKAMPRIVKGGGPSGIVDYADVLGESEGYEPLKTQTALFRKFAELPDDLEAFAAFARDYGMLHESRMWVSTDDDGRATILSMSSDLPGVELLPTLLSAEWVGQRKLLALGVRLFEALKADRTDTLSDVIAIRADGGCDWVLPLEADDERFLAMVADQDFRLWQSRKPIRGESAARKLAARALLAALFGVFGRPKGALVPDAAIRDMPGDTGLRLTFAPESLLQAMWLQLAWATNGNRTYKVCPVCKDWWDATDARSDKETCGDKCRKAKSRNSQEGRPR